MKLILLGLLMLGVTFAHRAPKDDDNDAVVDEYSWEQFLKDHDLSFDPKEELLRKELFKQHKTHIKKHNKKHRTGESSFKIGFNKFSVMTEDERKQYYGGKFDMPKANNERNRRGVGTTAIHVYNFTTPVFYAYSSDASVVSTLPASWDLRSKGWNETVQDQGQCGSCWSFSSSSMLSYYTFNKTGQNLVLSQQNLVDCAGIWGAGGCNGASPVQALWYFQQQKVTLKSTYPYKAVKGSCNSTILKSATLYGITGFYEVSENADSLRQALVKLGPVIVGIDADTLQNYASGVWNGADPKTGTMCTSTSNHAVLVIGYGTDATTKKDFWLIKNSWGTTWGEKGFFRMERSSTSLCGIFSSMYTAY